jgi:ribonuclease R
MVISFYSTKDLGQRIFLDTKIFKALIEGYEPANEEEINYLENLHQAGMLKKEFKAYILDGKYKIGTLDFEKKFARFIDISNEQKTIKLEFESLNGALNGDLVLIKRNFNPRSHNQGKVVKILQSSKNTLLVVVEENKLRTIKESIVLKNPVPKELKDKEIVLFNPQSNEVIQPLGFLHDAKIDESISLYLFEEEFRKEPFLEIDVNDYDLSGKNRVDLRHLPFCTIDPSSAKDHDDAIYFEPSTSTLYVAIADVSYFVQENSPLDKDAYKKATSVYLPHKVLPMLPPILSEQLCSLKQGQERLAYVFKMQLSQKDGVHVQSAELFEAIIKSHQNFSYGRIDRVLEGKFDQYSALQKEIFDSLVQLYALTQKLRSQRLVKGYDFRTTERRLKLNAKQELESIGIEQSSASHELVEECMLLANVQAAKRVNEVGIYRVHEEPSFEAISKLVNLVNELGIEVKMQGNVHDTILAIQQKASRTTFVNEVDELIIQSQVQAHYNSSNLGHFGLGFDSYSHFTSPIRRYSDLVLHRILKTKKTPENIDEMCAYISNEQRKIDQMVWDFEDRKYARWAQKHLNEEFKATIVDTTKAMAKLNEGASGLKVILDNYKAQSLFGKVKVIIKSVDMVSKTVLASIKQ